MKSSLNLFFLILISTNIASATAYHVGPGQAYSNIGDVPIENLTAGDTLYIHHRSTPYAEKFVLGAAGTQSQPVVIHGVADSGGNLPVITGDGATTRLQLDYWNEVRSVIKVGGTSTPGDNAGYIIIENLDVRSAREAYTFTDDSGNPQQYAGNAASIHIERGDNITIRNCKMRDSGNGLFTGSTATSVLIEYCEVYDNGKENSIYEHNSYTESDGITFQFNKYGRLRTNCLGNNLKDRSKGLVVRYNWIEGGNRQLDLVDSDYAAFYNSQEYRSTYVYSNILVEMQGQGNRQIVHYGGDSGNQTQYRKGTLYFYNNTVISNLPGNNTLFNLSSNDESTDVRNNVIYAQGALEIIADRDGTANLTNNWIQQGWVDALFPSGSGVLNDLGGNITGSLPGFVNQGASDYDIAVGSILIGNATTMHPSVPGSQYPVFEFANSFPDFQARSDYNDIGAISYHDMTGFNHLFNPNKKLLIYPNPSQSAFHIQSNRYRIERVIVLNSLGQVVNQIDEISGKIIFEIIGSSGIYWVQCFLENGDQVNRKVIKH